jgi:hypothetical protein
MIAEEDFMPAAVNGTEVELRFHSAHDPFGGQWEDEEVVIDRYASLEDAALRRQRVTSDQGRAIADAVAAAVGTRPEPVGPGAVDGGVNREQDGESAELDIDFDPASDPLLPEEAAADNLPRRAVVSLRSVTQDDRDMIVVDDEPSTPSAPTTNRPRRPEYRQLFSRLRNQ